MLLKTHYLYAHQLTYFMGDRSGGINAVIVAASAVTLSLGNLLIFFLAFLGHVNILEIDDISFDLRIPYMLLFLLLFFVFLRNRQRYIESNERVYFEAFGLVWVAAAYFVATFLLLYFALTYVSRLT